MTSFLSNCLATAWLISGVLAEDNCTCRLPRHLTGNVISGLARNGSIRGNFYFDLREELYFMNVTDSRFRQQSQGVHLIDVKNSKKIVLGLGVYPRDCRVSPYTGSYTVHFPKACVPGDEDSTGFIHYKHYANAANNNRCQLSTLEIDVYVPISGMMYYAYNQIAEASNPTQTKDLFHQAVSGCRGAYVDFPLG